MINELRWLIRHAWHRRQHTWVPWGPDALCHLCFYRVRGGGDFVPSATDWKVGA